jgi:hypothetical protein
LEDDSVRSLNRPLELRGRSSSGSRRSGTGSTTVTKREKEGGEFITGWILIWLALPMVWMNERKNVKIFKTIVAGEKVW